MPKRLTTEEFIEKAIEVHGDKYDYSKVEYVNSYTKICIICKEHGEFWQRPNDHLNTIGCKICSNKGSNSIEFIKKSINKFGDLFIYDNVFYKNNKTKVELICKKHGSFKIRPNDNLKGIGCPKCSKENNKFDSVEILKTCSLLHNNFYDYSKVKYIDSISKVNIICPLHGEFKQSIHNHLQGQGCKECGRLKKTLNLKDFIEKSKKVHNNIYDYSKVEYVNSRLKVCIICPVHGEFWQTPHGHLGGQGCPICKESRLEKEVRILLSDNNIEYVPQKRFEWLGSQSLDFYIPSINLAIECQGEQHFKPCEYFGGEETFKYINGLDENKKRLCEENGVKLVYFSKLKKYDSFLDESLIKDSDKLLKIIKAALN